MQYYFEAFVKIMSCGSNYILWGATGQALVLRDLLQDYDATLLACFDNNSKIQPPFADVPLLYGEKGLRHWLNSEKIDPTGVFAYVAIGGTKGKDRMSLMRMLENYKFRISSAIHLSTFVAHSAKIGKGCQLLANASVCAGSVLGNACIVNTGAIVEHGCIVDDGAHLAPGAIITGEVKVGENTFLGSGSVVLPRIRIGRNAIIGAGSVITRDVPDDVTVYGNPGRIRQ